jgi:uncharacterized protein DUF1810
MTDADLIRFLDAQDPIYQRVVEELANGRKETHWMWFIFPQLTGLGLSGMAQHYAIHDLDQARRYLADSILGPRLRQAVRLLIDQKGKFTYTFDAQTGEFGNLVSKGIIDPTEVVRVALQDGASIAGLLITTEAMVAEKPKKETPTPAMPPGGGMDY